MDNLPQHHIRLLHIEPGLWEDPIRCRLRVVSLQSPRSQPTYEALSYNWGSAEQKSPAVVCDEKSVRLTQNLYDALLHLRHPYQERIMWIDAVCIRQDNLKERAEQVSIMRYIFAQATRVIIWLGTENSEDKMAFSLLEQYKAVITEHGNAPKVGLAHLPYGLPALDKPEWIALAKFFQRPWFQRIWVLQEVAVSESSAYRRRMS